MSKPNNRIQDFARAMLGDWLARMSGPLSVPTAILGLWLGNDVAKVAFTFTAFVCFWVTAYRVWRPEREAATSLRERLDPRIQFIQIHQRSEMYANGINRIFDIEIQNTSAESIGAVPVASELDAVGEAVL